MHTVAAKVETEVWAGKRVAITGGLGFIGSNLARRLDDAGATVSIVDDLNPYCGGNLANADGLSGRVQIRYQNVENPDVVAEIAVENDVIFHCAALTSHPGSMLDPRANINTNCQGTIQILEAIKRYNPSCGIVFLGTTSQFGSLIRQPADETHPEFPLDIYSANKSASEKYALIYSKVHGTRVSVVRLPNVYGPRAAIHSPDLSFMNFFIGRALGGQTITVYGEGSQKRSVLHVADAVDALLAAGSNPAAVGEVFLAASNKNYSVFELAEAIVATAGKGRVERIPWPALAASIEIGSLQFNADKIHKTLGWQPQIGLHDGLRATLLFYRKEIDRYLK